MVMLLMLEPSFTVALAVSVTGVPAVVAYDVAVNDTFGDFLSKRKHLFPDWASANDVLQIFRLFSW